MKVGLVNSDSDNEIYRHSEAGIQFELPKGWKAKPDGDTVCICWWEL
jgi:hypothetical protein